MTETRTNPNGCRWCGIAQLEHAQRWHYTAPGDGRHGWEPPTDEQRLVRMRRRRLANGKPLPPRRGIAVAVWRNEHDDTLLLRLGDGKLYEIPAGTNELLIVDDHVGTDWVELTP